MSNSIPGILPLMQSGFNITHFLNIKLDKGNFLVWRSQFLPILKLHDLEGLVDGTSLCPTKFLPSSTSNAIPTLNPDYIKWMKMDQMLLCWLISSLTEPVLAHVVGLTTSREVWCSLERIFSSSSRARVQQLKYQLHTVKMATSSMAEYIQSVKSIVDNLAAVAHPVADFDLVSTLLSGLSSDYDSYR